VSFIVHVSARNLDALPVPVAAALLLAIREHHFPVTIPSLQDCSHLITPLFVYLSLMTIFCTSQQPALSILK